jgi:hypothetical protein
MKNVLLRTLWYVNPEPQETPAISKRDQRRNIFKSMESKRNIKIDYLPLYLPALMADDDPLLKHNTWVFASLQLWFNTLLLLLITLFC